MPIAETPADTPNNEVFAPSLFSQVQDALKDGSIKSELPPTELDPDDIQGVLEMPFDVAAFITKVEDLGLSPEESKKLCKIWVKPMQKLLGKYPKADLILAATVTMGIITEKVILFYMAQEKQAKLKQAQESASDKGQAKKEELDAARGAFAHA